MPIRPLAGIATVAAGAAGYFVGSMYTGQVKFGVSGSPAAISQYINKLALVQELKQDPRYELHRPWDVDRTIMTKNIMQIDGGIADPLVFVDKLNRGHTISVTHCGGRTCGFPYLVHGGLLGLLLEDSLTEAATSMGKTGIKNMQLSYKHPTMVNQAVIVETFRTENDKLAGTIVSLKGKTLVKAVSDIK